MIEYLKHSNVVVSFKLNPFSWSIIPRYEKGMTVWDENDYKFDFLFLAVTVVIDNGDW
jgi:hypothetical protein